MNSSRIVRLIADEVHLDTNLPDTPLAITLGTRTKPSGHADAPVSVVIFADFECPYCKLAAALAYLAAAKQGKGRLMHGLLFAHAADLSDKAMDVCAAAAGLVRIEEERGTLAQAK